MTAEEVCDTVGSGEILKVEDVNICKQNAFTFKTFKINTYGQNVPVTSRQSDRIGTRKLAIDLKRRIEKGKFLSGKPLKI